MKIRLYLFVLILISALLSIPLIARKVNIEQSNKKVDFILDYYQVEDLAEQSDKPIEWWLEEFKKMGVSSVGINFETIENMMDSGKKIQADIITNIIERPDWRSEYPLDLVSYIDDENTDKYDLVARFENAEDYQFAADGLTEKYGDKIKLFGGTNYNYIVIDTKYKDGLYTDKETLVTNEGKRVGNAKKLEGSIGAILPIGIDPSKVELIENAGMKVSARMTNPPKRWYSQKYLESVFKDVESINNKSSHMVFAGDEILGSPKDLDKTIEFLKKNKLDIGLVETVFERSYIEQKGMDKVLEKIGYNVNKVYSVPSYIQTRYEYVNYKHGEEIGNVLYRAITERNANVIYFRPFIDKDGYYVEKVKDYQNMFSDLSDRLESHGISYGTPEPYGNNTVRKIAVICLSLGVVSAGVLVLRQLFKINEKTQIILFVLGMLGVIGAVFALGRMGYMLVAIATAIIFPSLAITYYNSVNKRIFLYDSDVSYKDSLIKGIKVFIVSALITSIGSLIISAIMSSTRNVLDIDYFKGVKITQLIPFVVYFISFLGHFGYKKVKDRGDDVVTKSDLEEVFNDTTKVFYFAIIGVIGAVGYVYLARTGHEAGLEPSNLELMFRNGLERALYARPRTKEFLIAFPALIIGITFAKNRIKSLYFLSGLAGVVGLTSIANTFSHFKTPFMISVARLMYSTVFGIIIAAVYLAVIFLVITFVRKNYRRFLNE